MSKVKITPQQLRQLQLTDEKHPRWSSEFAETARCAQVEEDLFAARSVSAVLIAIVTGGALLGAFGVIVASLLR